MLVGWGELLSIEMTASEPLSLDEEYAMQRSWHEDPKSMQYNKTYIKEDEKKKRKKFI